MEDDYLSEIGAFGVDRRPFQNRMRRLSESRAEMPLMENVSMITTADFFTPYSSQFGNVDVIGMY